MAQAPMRVITVHEFNAVLQASDNQARSLELIYGDVVEKMPTELHGKLAALIAHFLLAFILPRGIQAHVGVEVRHELADDPYNSRLPDVSLRLSAEAAVASGPVPQMPDLAVEVQSPDDRPYQMREKALFYLRSGSRLVWLFYPAAQRVEVCTLDANDTLAIETLAHSATLSGGQVLPEFRLALQDLFKLL
jgi:Uma2 family endonuclease